MMAGVHPGLPRIGKSGHDGGASAFGAGEVFRGQQKQSAAVITGRRAFAPCPAICYSAPKICSWQPRCRFFPAGVRMKKASLPLVLTGLGFNPNGPRGLPPKNGRTVSDCGAYGIAEHRRAYGRAEKVRTWLRAAARPPAPGSRRAATRPCSGARVSGAQGSTAQGSTAQGSTRRSPGDGR
jgi:hypothetical protein